MIKKRKDVLEALEDELSAARKSYSTLKEDNDPVKEFIYKNEVNKEDEDPDGDWWLLLAGICFVWIIFGIIGAIKVMQWIIQLLKTLFV